MDAVLPYELRAWQRRAGAAWANLLRARPNARAIVSAATGTGKSRFAFYVSAAMGARTLFLVHLDNLATQVLEEFRRLFPDVRSGLVKAEQDNYLERFVVASVQTLARPERLARLIEAQANVRAGPFDLVIVDECHHGKGGSVYETVMASFPDAPCLGLTATPGRSDKEPLGVCFPDDVVYSYPIPQAIADGVLVPVSDGEGHVGRSRLVQVEGLDADLARVLDGGSTPDLDERRRAASAEATAHAAEEATKVFRRRCVGFTVDVRAAKDAAAACVARGVRAAAIDGSMSRKAQRALLTAHRKHELDLLLCAQLLVEGYDDPGIDGVLWCRPTLSAPFYVQGVGRALRIDPKRPRGHPGGKEDAIVWDLVGAHEAHGLVVAAHVFGDAPAPTEDVEEDEGDATPPAPAAGDERHQKLLASFLAHLSGRRTLAAVRGNHVAWLEVKADKAYALGGADGATYLVERDARDANLWVAVREGRDREGAAVRLARPGSLDDARRIAEAAARAGESFDRRDAGWRTKAASDRMLAALARWKVDLPPGTTAGDASDALTIAVAKSKRRSRAFRDVEHAGGSLLD